MRRAVLEIESTEIGKFLGEALPLEFDSFEVLAFLREDVREVAMVCKVSLKDPATLPEEVFSGSSLQVQVLEKLDKQTWICFVKRRRFSRGSIQHRLLAHGYLSTPFFLKGGSLTASFLGSAAEVKGLLRKLDALGARYRVVSMGDAKFSFDSPMNRLTEKQLRVIVTAYNLGYYGLPRRVSSRELASKLKMSEPTLVMHRRKAEKRLFGAILSR